MKKMIITNNPKAQKFELAMEVEYLANKSVLAVLNEGKKLAERGGQLLVDPNKSSPAKAYYKSLPFFMNSSTNPDERSLSLINAALSQAEKAGLTEDAGKEPLMAGLLQGKDYDLIEKVLG